MADTSWNNGGVAPTGPRRSWLKWGLVGLAVVLGFPLLMTLTFGSLALRHRAKLWPAVRAIHARLQTDEGAKDLFSKNPALANTYVNDQDFVDVVRAWRAKVGDLPSLEPPEGPTYSPNSDPGGVSAAIQGSGGAWMRVDIRGGRLAGPVEGEGITRLYFAEDRKGLREARRKATALRTGREWENYRKVMLRCSDDSQAAALYRQEPGLRANYPSESAFLEAAKALRPAIAKLPVALRDDASEFGIRNYHTPFTNSHVLIFLCADGQELRAIWKNGQLSKVELRPANSHG
ncbi:MAG: hypothetical protein KGN80_02815 [Acidobacteriota bacterium]|nr:hypothetical protein [Acidobacteriota bacterium]